MPIDPDTALGAELPVQKFSWTTSDVQTYNLALGAGSRPLDAAELRYLDDAKPQVLPTFATVAATFHESQAPRVEFPGIEIDLTKVVHGSQEVSVSAPLPPSGSASSTSRITEIWDKGSAAVIVQETIATSDDGIELWRTRSSIFARGEGGFGGERGTGSKTAAPIREPDVVVGVPTLPQQALMYRMCGDRNPLHSDPVFATAAGFSAPILHGLCTYGMVCKAVVDSILGGDASAVRSFGSKFAGVVFPGEELQLHIWKDQDLLTISVTVPSRGNAPALAEVTVRTFEESECLTSNAGPFSQPGQALSRSRESSVRRR